MKLMKQNGFSEVGPSTWLLKGASSLFHFDGTPSCPLTSNTTGELDIFGHYGNTLRMYRTQVCVLEQPHQVSLGGFL